MLLTFSIGAGAFAEFHETGDFFRLLNAEADVTVRYYAKGRELVEAENVGGGYAERFAEPFDRFVIESATAQEVQFVARLGNDVRYDTPPNGRVTVTNTAGVFTQGGHTVTTASATLRAENLARRYLLVQNNDASASVFVTVDGSAATAATGVKLGPGGSLELSGYVPTGAVNAVGDAVSNANVMTVEG